MQKNDNQTVTFNIKGYSPITCRCIGENSKNELSVASYETYLSDDERNLRNNELVSNIIKNLSNQFSHLEKIAS